MRKVVVALFSSALFFTMLTGQPAQAAAPDFTIKVGGRCKLPGDLRDYHVSVSWRIRGSDGKAKPIHMAFSLASGSGDTYKVGRLATSLVYNDDYKEHWDKRFSPTVTVGALNANSNYGDAEAPFRPRSPQEVWVGLYTGGGSRLCSVVVPN